MLYSLHMSGMSQPSSLSQRHAYVWMSPTQDLHTFRHMTCIYATIVCAENAHAEDAYLSDSYNETHKLEQTTVRPAVISKLNRKFIRYSAH